MQDISSKNASGLEISDEHQPYITVGPSGRQKITFMRPKPEQIVIGHIAYALSRLPRYNGNTFGDPLTVAWHSVVGAKLASSQKIALEFLLHDASEYALGDVPGPLKKFLPDYRYIEKQFQDCILMKYLGYTELDPEVKKIDKIMEHTERKYYRKEQREFPLALSAPDALLIREVTESVFLDKFHSLTEGRFNAE